MNMKTIMDATPPTVVHDDVNDNNDDRRHHRHCLLDAERNETAALCEILAAAGFRFDDEDDNDNDDDSPNDNNQLHQRQRQRPHPLYHRYHKSMEQFVTRDPSTGRIVSLCIAPDAYELGSSWILPNCIGKLTKLRSLHLAKCHSLADATHGLSQLHELQVLSFYQCHNINVGQCSGRNSRDGFGRKSTIAAAADVDDDHVNVNDVLDWQVTLTNVTELCIMDCHNVRPMDFGGFTNIRTLFWELPSKQLESQQQQQHTNEDHDHEITTNDNVNDNNNNNATTTVDCCCDWKNLVEDLMPNTNDDDRDDNDDDNHDQFRKRLNFRTSLRRLHLVYDNMDTMDAQRMVFWSTYPTNLPSLIDLRLRTRQCVPFQQLVGREHNNTYNNNIIPSRLQRFSLKDTDTSFYQQEEEGGDVENSSDNNDIDDNDDDECQEEIILLQNVIYFLEWICPQLCVLNLAEIRRRQTITRLLIDHQNNNRRHTHTVPSQQRQQQHSHLPINGTISTNTSTSPTTSMSTKHCQQQQIQSLRNTIRHLLIVNGYGGRALLTQQQQKGVVIMKRRRQKTKNRNHNDDDDIVDDDNVNVPTSLWPYILARAQQNHHQYHQRRQAVRSSSVHSTPATATATTVTATTETTTTVSHDHSTSSIGAAAVDLDNNSNSSSSSLTSTVSLSSSSSSSLLSSSPSSSISGGSTDSINTHQVVGSSTSSSVRRRKTVRRNPMDTMRDPWGKSLSNISSHAVYYALRNGPALASPSM